MKNAIQFFCIVVFISVIGKQFINEDKEFERVFSVAQLLFILFFLMLGKPSFGYSWSDVLTGAGRLGFTFGTYELNPNILAMLSAIAFLYELRRKHYIFMSPHFLIILLTQSRGALVFIACTLIFTKIKNIREFSGFVVLLIVLLIITYFSPLWEPLSGRFINDGGSARGEIWSHYINMIQSNFPMPSTREQFFYISDNFGPLDNFYLMSLIRFGLVGGLYCLYLIFSCTQHYFSSNDKFYPSFCISFLVYGLVESGPIHNLMYAITFSMAYAHGRNFFKLGGGGNSAR